jgi:glucosamine--fructose-6-phosphate aminotransferase (isomerizing)
MKHGPIALIDEAVPIIVIARMTCISKKTISNMQEVMARGGKVLLISDGHGIARVWASIEVPKTNAFITPLLRFRCSCWHYARSKGTDVDQPRNLRRA